MEFNNVIKSRRSIRKFKNEMISREIIEQILEDGILAPSAKNRQPWRFCVITDITVKDKIVNMLLDKAKDLIEKDKKGFLVKNTARAMMEAPVIICVFNAYNEEYLKFNLQSIGACIQNICLSATNRNIGSLWIGHTEHIHKEIEEMLGKQEWRLEACVALGYANEEPIQRPRLLMEEITQWL